MFSDSYPALSIFQRELGRRTALNCCNLHSQRYTRLNLTHRAFKHKQWTRSNESNTGSVAEESPPSDVLRSKLDFLSAPVIPRREFIRAFPVCDPLLLPHLSLDANTQLLGYLSRVPIKGCHSGLQCPRANHIRAPAHAQPPPCLLLHRPC